MSFQRNREYEVQHFAKTEFAADIPTGDAYCYLDLISKTHGIGYWRLEVTTGEVFWSPKVFSIHGLPYAKGPVDLGFALDLYHEEDQSVVADIIKRTIETGEGFRFILRLNHVSGSLRLVESYCQSETDNKGKVVRLLGTFRDVTDYVESQNRLDSCTDMLITMVRHMPAAVAVFDKSLRFLAASERYKADYLIPEEQTLEGEILTNVFPDIPMEIRVDYQKVLGGEKITKTGVEIVHKSGRKVMENAYMEPWYLPNGDVGGIITMLEIEELEAGDGCSETTYKLPDAPPQHEVLALLETRTSMAGLGEISGLLSNYNSYDGNENQPKVDTLLDPENEEPEQGDGGIYDMVWQAEKTS